MTAYCGIIVFNARPCMTCAVNPYPQTARLVATPPVRIAAAATHPKQTNTYEGN